MNMHPGQHALRTGRASLAGQAYLVTSVTYRRTPLFADWEAATVAARALTDRVLWRASQPLCWVLMPDHWHVLLELAEGDTLPGLMRRLKSASAARLRQSLEPGTRVWAPSFHDRALRTEEDLPDTARYIVANPLRAGLCRSVRDYPFWNAVWL
jgi:REP element-mobilizing transposase RayT